MFGVLSNLAHHHTRIRTPSYRRKMAVWSSILCAARQKLLQNSGTGTVLLKNGDYSDGRSRSRSSDDMLVILFGALLRKPTVFCYATTAQCIWSITSDGSRSRSKRVWIKTRSYEALRIFKLLATNFSIIIFFENFWHSGITLALHTQTCTWQCRVVQNPASLFMSFVAIIPTNLVLIVFHTAQNIPAILLGCFSTMLSVAAMLEK